MDKACHPLKDTRDFHRTACHPLKRRGRNSENDPVARVSQVHHNEPRLLRLSLPGGRGQGREGELKLERDRFGGLACRRRKNHGDKYTPQERDIARGDRSNAEQASARGWGRPERLASAGGGGDSGAHEEQAGLGVVAVQLEQLFVKLIVGVEELLALPLVVRNRARHGQTRKVGMGVGDSAWGGGSSHVSVIPQRIASLHDSLQLVALGRAAFLHTG